MPLVPPPFEYPHAVANGTLSALLFSILDASAVLPSQTHLLFPFTHRLDLLLLGWGNAFKDRSTDFDGWLNLSLRVQAREHGRIKPFSHVVLWPPQMPWGGTRGQPQGSRKLSGSVKAAAPS